MANRQSLTANG